MFPIETFQATLGKAVSIFEKFSLPYHITGGVTTAYYGEPRMTQDIDVVVENEGIAAQLEAFLSALSASDFIYSEDAVRLAVEKRELFQLVDQVEALKIDVYPRELIPGELSRSERGEVFKGVFLPVVSRADAAASKLVWISKGSHKSRRDLRHIVRTASADEREMIDRLAGELGLTDLLAEVLNEPDELIE